MKSPFKFLDSYTKDDRDIFFGRDREIEELYHRVFESRLMLVYGVSGTGKSSLIHCGLANKFGDTDWLPVGVRRGSNMIESLADAISAASLTKSEDAFTTPVQFKKAVRSLYLDHYKPVFFIFDQFEELFIFGTRDERKAFIHIIKSLLESDLQCRFIFIMREEYMASITEFERYIPTFFSNRVRIEKMLHANALDAIKGPCKVAGIDLEEGFAETLIRIISPGDGDIELTYLQVFLDKLFRQTHESIKPSANNDGNGSSSGSEKVSGISFTINLLTRTGNVSDLLGEFLDNQISLMEDPEGALAVLKAFVSGKGTKRPASEQEAVENVRSIGKHIDPEVVKSQIQAFVRLRVFREKDDNGRYELRHDALAEKVFEKFSTAEKELLEIKQMIENAYQYYLKRKILLSNDDLKFIANKDTSLELNKELKEFMDLCRQHQRAKQRTIKRLTVSSAFAFIILLSTLIYTFADRGKKSSSILLAKESLTQFTRPMDRICVASDAWLAYKTEEAKEALLTSFYECIMNPGGIDELNKLRDEYLIIYEPAGSELEYAAYSKDNNLIYGCTKDSVYIWNKNGKMTSSFSTGGKQQYSLEISMDGNYLGAFNDDSLLTVWDLSGNYIFSRKIWYNQTNKEQVFRFTKDNLTLALTTHNHSELIDINGNTIQTFNLNETDANAIDISDDERFIAVAGSDSCVHIWYKHPGNHRYEFYNKVILSSDTILSVDFAGNCKYFISCSSDRMVTVASIAGAVVWRVKARDFMIDRNSLSPGYPYFAKFSDSLRGITIKLSPAGNNRNNSFINAVYVDTDYNLVQTGQLSKFDYVSFSTDNNYIAVSDSNGSVLLSRNWFINQENILINNYRLLNFTGKNPFFSSDGRYISSINGNHIESWIINIDSIAIAALDLKEVWEKYFDQIQVF